MRSWPLSWRAALATPAAPSEPAVVQRARAGDGDAFGSLVEQHADRIYRLTLRMAGPDAAEDLAQQTFLKAWRGLNGFTGGADFGTWLYRIAINICMDHLRRTVRERHVPLADNQLLPADSDLAESVVNGLERAEQRAALAWALARLPAEDRLLLYLRIAEEQPYEAIAALLTTNVRTVGTRLYRARARLQRLTRSYLEERNHDLR